VNNIHSQRILVIDLGSESARLLARSVRAAGVYSEIMAATDDSAASARIREFAPAGIVLSDAMQPDKGSAAKKIPDIVFSLGVPVLGIGAGMQAMVEKLGGKSGSGQQTAAENRVFPDHEDSGKLLQSIEGLNKSLGLKAAFSHCSSPAELPVGFSPSGTTADGQIAGMHDDRRRFYGLGFQPENNRTEAGQDIIRQFALNICGCRGDWTTDRIIDDQISRVRSTVGSDTVLLGLSGGVDSSVVAALLHRAIGEQLLCIFVDTGLLRHREGDEVMALFAEHLGARVERIDARDQFMQALAGVSDPEEKRKIIGHEFIEVFNAAAGRHREAGWLAQGTIYPDVIESGAGGQGGTIKSHHNVGGLPDDMQLGLIEPLRELFKDEVRQIGLKLGLPETLIMRHPFPGPGLGVRILGEVRPEYVQILQQADHIFISELRNAGLYHQTSQAFAVFLPVKSVGVVNGQRRYQYVISLRAVQTVDFMTARAAPLDHDFLDRVSRRIITECPEVSRVVYDISAKPPATIEWE